MLLTAIAVIFGLHSNLLQATVVQLDQEIEVLTERPDELRIFLSRPEFTDLYPRRCVNPRRFSRICLIESSGLCPRLSRPARIGLKQQ